MGRGIKGFMAFCMAAVIGFNTVHADPLQNQLKQQKIELENNRTTLRSMEDKRDELESTIEELDGKIEDMLTIIDNNKEQMTAVQKDIDSANSRIDELNSKIETQKELMSRRVRALYMGGETNYLIILLDANGVRDFITRLETVSRVIAHDRKAVLQIEASKKQVEKEKEALAVDMDKLLVLKAENDNKLLEMNSAIKNQQQLISQLNEQESIFANKVSESQNLVNETLRQINSAANQVTGSRALSFKASEAPGETLLVNKDLLSYAASFIGTPYVWGGTQPVPGFDCSGFTQYVFAHFGVKIGRTTRDQIKDGTEISRDALQPGDLVFFGRNGIPTHVGIYAGSNTYINSPRTGDFVKISPMTRKDFLTARRVR